MLTRHTRNRIVITLTVVCAWGGLLVAPAGAEIQSTKQTGGQGAFSVRTNDAADASQGGTTSFSGSYFAPGVGATGPDYVIDGGVYDPKWNSYSYISHSLPPDDGGVLILNLAPGNGLGWDISEIVVLTGMAQVKRTDHYYTIALSTDGSTFGTTMNLLNACGSRMPTCLPISCTASDV